MLSLSRKSSRIYYYYYYSKWRNFISRRRMVFRASARRICIIIIIIIAGDYCHRISTSGRRGKTGRREGTPREKKKINDSASLFTRFRRVFYVVAACGFLIRYFIVFFCARTVASVSRQCNCMKKNSLPSPDIRLVAVVAEIIYILFLLQ